MVRVWGEGVKTEVLGNWKREWEERGGHGDRRVGILDLADMGRGGATPLRGGGDGLLGGGSSEAGFLNARIAFGMTGYYFFGEFEGTEDPAFADSEWGGTERKSRSLAALGMTFIFWSWRRLADLKFGQYMNPRGPA
jgi:hypothetical protein